MFFLCKFRENAVDVNVGLKWPQFLAGELASVGAICSGLLFGWSVYSFSDLERDLCSAYRVQDEQKSRILSLTTLGMLVGALPAGFLADVLGRKSLLLLLVALFLLTGVVSPRLVRIDWLVQTSAFVSAVAGGAASVVIPLYNDEIAHANIRGALGCLYELNFCIGNLLSCILVTMPCQAFTYVYCMLTTLFGMSFIFVPESPVYLMSRGRIPEAEASVHWLRADRRNPDIDISIEITELQKFIEDRKLDALSKKYNMKKSRLLCGLRKGDNLIMIFSLMIYRQICGINMFMTQSKVFFDEYESVLEPSAHNIILAVLLVVFSLVSLNTADGMGRRFLLIFSFVGISVCLAISSQFYFMGDTGHDVTRWTWVPLLSMVVFVAMFSIGIGPVSWLIMAELLPRETRKWSLGLSASLNWVVLYLYVSYFDSVIDNLGLAATFGVLFVLGIIGTILVIFFSPETKNRSRSELQ